MRCCKYRSIKGNLIRTDGENEKEKDKIYLFGRKMLISQLIYVPYGQLLPVWKAKKHCHEEGG